MPIVNCCERVLADSSAGSVVSESGESGNRRTGSRRTDPTRGRGVTLLHSPHHTTHRTDLPCRQSSNSPQLPFVSYSFARPQPTFNFALSPLKTRLSARSCARTYATASAPRKGIPPISDLFFFSPSLLTRFAADLIQNIYLKELKSYKAPPAVSRPVFMF